jgi:hypothetical protein
LNSSRSCFNNLQLCLEMMNKPRNRQCLWRNSMKSLREIGERIFQIWNYEVLLWFSVRISYIYHLLMKLLITIKPKCKWINEIQVLMQNGKITLTCAWQWNNARFSLGMSFKCCLEAKAIARKWK